jgi:protein strawberry notch
MASALDELTAPPGPEPGSPESVGAPTPFDVQNQKREAGFESEFGGQASAVPNRRQQAVNRYRAADLSARGIPSYTDASGNVNEVRDPGTGEALTTGKQSIAYDSQGQPKAISYGDKGPPVVSDPFANLPSRVNPDTGAIEKTGPKGLYQYEGQDPTVTAKLAQDASDKEIAKQSALLGRKLTLDEHDLLTGNKDLDESRKNLVNQVPTLGSPKYDDKSSQEDIMKAVNEHFDAQYAAPEANQTAGWFGKGLSPEATALRASIDAKKAQATADVQSHFALKQRLSDLDDSVAATRQAEQADVGTLLSHTVGGPGALAAPAGASAAPEKLYPPTADWPRMLGGDEAAHAVQGNQVMPGGAKSDNEPVALTPKEDLDKPFRSDEKSYRVGEDKSFHLDPNNLVKGLHQGVEDGLISDDKAKEVLPQLKQVSDAIDERNQIIRDAGGASKIKAVAHGAGMGAAFLAGFGPGSAAGAEAGAFGGPLDPITVPAGAIIGGLIGGGLTQYGAKKLVNKLAESNDVIRSATASAEIHPYYDAAGNLISMAAGVPRAGAEALVRAAGENKVAQSIANSYLRSSGGLYSTISNLAGDASIRAAGGASTATIAKALATRVGGAAAVNVVIDTAINEGAKALGFQKQGETLPSAVQAALVGTFMAGHGIEFKEYSQNQMADILVRAKGAMDAGKDIGTVLDPKETEAFNAFSTELRRKVNTGELPIDTQAVAGTVRQALQGGKPYGVSASDIEGRGGTPELPEGPLRPVPEQPTGGGETSGKGISTSGRVSPAEPGPGGETAGEPAAAKGGAAAETAEGKGRGAAVAGRGGPTGGGRLETEQPKGGETNERPVQTGPAVATGKAERAGAGAKGGEAVSESAEHVERPGAVAVKDTESGVERGGGGRVLTVDQAAHEAATSPKNELPEPTLAQKEAGNYKKGHVNVGGLDVAIENPAGSKRQPQFEPLKSHYGYVKGTVGADKDHVDVFIKPGTPTDYAGPVYVVNQHTGGIGSKFDEHKAVIGVNSHSAALREYESNYEKGWKGAHSVVKFDNPTVFKKWAESGVKGPLDRETADNLNLAAKVEGGKGEITEQKGGGAQGPPEKKQAEPADTGLAAKGERGGPVTSEAGAGAGRGTGRVRIDTVAGARRGVEAAKEKHAEEIAELGIQHVEGKVGRAGIKTDANGTITVDHEASAKAAAVVHDQGGDSQDWFNDRHKEELIHHRGLLATGPEFDSKHQAAWNSLHKGAKAGTKELYPDTKHQPALGAEYVRMVQQYRESGHTTESHFRSIEKIEPFLKGKQTPEVEDLLRQMKLVTAKVLEHEKPTEDVRTRMSKLDRRATELKARFQALPEVPAREMMVINTLLKSRTGAALDQAEQKIARLEEKHATISGKQPSGEREELPRVPTRENLRPHEGEVREKEGERPAGGGGAVERPEASKSEQKPGAGQPARATGLDEKANEALDKAFEGLFAGTPYQPTVRFRGEEFTGESHEAAIEKLAKRFPRYRESDRKAEPIVRGWKTPEGQFKTLMQIARPWASSDAQQQTAWLDKQANQRGMTLSALAIDKPETFTKLATAWRNTHPPSIPPLPPGERLVTVKRPDGSTYQASFGGKYWEGFPGRPEMIGKPVQGGWSHGMIGEGEKIVEELHAAEPQLAIPAEKLGAVVAAAQEMIRMGIDTPEKMAEVLEEKFAGKARPYSQATWDAIGIVRPDLRGTPDWPSIYGASSEREKKDKGMPLSAIVAPKTADELTFAVKSALRTTEGLSRRSLTELGKSTGLSAKEIDEAAEMGVVQAAREIAQGKGTPEEKFDKLVDLYNRQPNLTAKTSTSKVAQAYSTPAPLAFAAGHLAGLETAHSAYEPTAGNGMLTIAGKPDIFHVNEKDPARFAALSGQGFAFVSQKDALTERPFKAPVEAIVANPPFGTVLEEQESKTFPMFGGETKQIDFAIAARALESLSPHGRAVLILGGKNIIDPEERAKAYARQDFWPKLYDKYRVVDQFTVNGDLYAKQGAGWPVDVVIIAGRGKSPIMLPSAEGPRILNSWNELRNELSRTDEQRIEAGRYSPERDREKIGGVFGAIERIAGSEPRTGPAPDTEPAPRADVGRGSGEITAPAAVGQPLASAGAEQAGARSGAEPAGLVGAQPGDVGNQQRGPLTAFRVPYKPVSALPSFNVFVPTNLEAPIRDGLERLVAKVGPLDQYIRQKLGYRADAPLERYFSGEQIDAMSQAIDAIESGVAAVNGDQGGIGKGRAAAGLMAYAVTQGKIPIFVTKDVKLYAAMIEDLHDIGRDDLVPMFTDNDLSFEDYADNKWQQGNMRDELNEIARTGKLPKDVHALFTTYAQIQTDQPKGFKASLQERASMKRKHQPPPDGARMAALRRLAPNSIIIADESHLASGDSIRAWRLAPLLAEAHGVAYSSATFAKRPDSMGIYSQTSLSHATNNMDELVDAMKQGGVPLQQVVTGTLAGDGLYMRRERDFSKAVFRTHVNVDTQKRDTQLADNYTYGLRTILGISNQMKEAVRELNKIVRRQGKQMQVDNPPRIESTNFAAKIHNLASQYLFAIKAESVIRRTVKGVTEGFKNAEGNTVPHKVIITFQNTMEQPMLDLKRGGRPFTFNGMLLKYLDTQRELRSGRGATAQKVTITDTPDPQFTQFTDKQLQDHLIVPHPTDPDAEAGINEAALNELFRRKMSAIFQAAEQKLEAIELGDMPLSPIDHIRQALDKVGIKNAEITGRSIGLDAEGKLYPIHPSSHTKKAHLRTLNAFNNTDVDALLMNASGSTGISAHSSAKFKNTTPRAMLVAQLNNDINDQIQTFYRTDRTGQVHQPYYEVVQTALPAELRPAAIFGRKMASLNANTTSNAENEISTGNKGVDIFNQYGDEVVWNYLKSNREFLDLLDMPGVMDGPKLAPLADIVADLEDGQFAGKVTGRAAVLPVAEAELFWDKVMSDYVAQIDYLNEIGENDLIADTVDLKAETLDSKELTPAKTGFGRPSGFDAPSNLERIKADIGKKPLPAAEVIKMMDAMGEQAHAISTEWTAKVNAWKRAKLEKLAKNVLWNADKEQAYLDRWRDQQEEISASIALIGSGLHIKTEKGTDGYGAISAVKFDEEHPLTPSKQIFTVFINTTKQSLKIPASQLPTVARLAVGDFKDIYEGTAERSNERYMITGNLLSAYLAIHDSAPTAKIVQYTTDKGEVRQGILMPNKFSPGDLAKKLVVESPGHMRELVNAGRSLTSAGGAITMVKNAAGEYVLRVPSSRTMGGAYWRDSQLAGLMDDSQFIERGGAMVGKFGAGKADAVFNRLASLDATLYYQEQAEGLHAARPIRAAKAAADDVETVAKSIGMGAKEALIMLQHLVSPTTGVAMDAHDAAMRMIGERNQKAFETDRVLEAFRQSFDKMPREEQVAFVDRMKRGEAQPTPELQQVAQTMRKIDTESWEAARQAYAALGFKDKEIPLKWLENHYRVLWKVIPGADDEEKAVWIGKSRRPLRGSMSQHKQHTLDDMSEGLQMGGVPYSYNPVQMFKLAQVDLWKLTTTLKAWKWAKDNNFVEFVRGLFPKAPDGMVQLNDSIANVYFPAESGEGLIHAGKYFVEEGFGRMLNNYLSVDHIRQVALGRGLLWLKNATTSLELSLSVFHGVFETLETIGSNIGLGLTQLINRGILKGDLGAAAEGIRTMVTAPFTPISGFQLGREIHKALADPEAYFKTPAGKKMEKTYPGARQAIDALWVGGFKPAALEQDWKNNSIRTFVEAVSDIKAGTSDNYIGAGLRAFPAANEMLMKPLFDVYIPNLKAAQFLKEYIEAKQQNERKLKGGILTEAALARQVWRFVENRFGELNYDTLFWNNNFKSAMQLMFRSVTWKLGTLDAFYGAFKGQAKEFTDAFKERRAPELHRNMAWLFGMMLLTATIGYITMKTLSGKTPKNMTDLVFPQIDPKDDKVRVSWPTYWKDMIHLIHSPISYVTSSMSSWIGRLADLWRNKDYYGTQIHDNDDPILKQALAIGKYLGATMLPFSVRGYKNLSANDQNTLRKLLAVIGVVPAPRFIGQTPAERASEAYWQGQRSEEGIRPEQYEAKSEKRKIVAQLRHGEAPNMSAALARGTIKPTDIKALYQRAQMGALASQVLHMPLYDAEKIYQRANLKERAELEPIMAKKRLNSLAQKHTLFSGF